VAVLDTRFHFRLDAPGKRLKEFLLNIPVLFTSVCIPSHGGWALWDF
jgi:hypothetical protein